MSTVFIISSSFQLLLIIKNRLVLTSDHLHYTNSISYWDTARRYV